MSIAIRVHHFLECYWLLVLLHLAIMLIIMLFIVIFVILLAVCWCCAYYAMSILNSCFC